VVEDYPEYEEYTRIDPGVSEEELEAELADLDNEDMAEIRDT
jgi:hypothetical protein